MSSIERATTATILAASGAAGILIDVRGEILWLEDPLHLLSQLAPEQAIGRPLAELFAVQGPESLWELVGRALEGRKTGPIDVQPAAALLAGGASPQAVPSFSLRFAPAQVERAGDEVLALLLPPDPRSKPTPLPSSAGEAEAGADGPEAPLPAEWYRKLLDLMPDGVAVIDEDGRIAFVNLYGANQFGYRVDELLGRRVVDLVAPEDRLHALPALLRTGVQPEGPVTFRILCADGTLAVAELRGQLLIDEQGRRSTVTMLRDVTREARLQERARARNVEEAIATFSGGMAHELRSLLDEIDHVLQQAHQPGFAPAGQALRLAAERTAKHIEHGREIAARLQTISGQHPHHDHHPLPLNETVAAADRELRRSLGPSVLVRTALSSDDPIVQGSAERLMRVVLQLSQNAKQAMPLGGHLLLRTDRVLVDEDLLHGIPEARPGCFAMLTVQDDGVGIEPEIIDRVFTPYFTTHSEGQGCGLGLALVLAIVREHRGFVSIESQPGRGTRFRVYLPLHQPGLPEPGGRLKMGLGRRRGSETLLLVDDREGIRPSLQPLLAQAGYRVLVANGRLEAAGLLERYHEMIDLAVIDISAPLQRASGLAQDLRRHKPGIKLIITAETAEQGKLAAREGKPLTVLGRQPGAALLHQAVRQLLDG